MSAWPWYAGGAALASVMLLHWFALRRMMAVSGRYTAIVDRMRHGPTDDTPRDVSADEMVAALRAATAAEFGAGALEAAPEPEPVAAPEPPRQSTAAHLVFFGSLAVGGLLSSLLDGRFAPAFTLRGEAFARLTRGSPLVGAAVLLVGGVLVGFGTRMASGCTSGHGLCGVSRFQKGSLVATMAFFGAGVLVSLALARLS